MTTQNHTHICGFNYINYKPIGVYQIGKKNKERKNKVNSSLRFEPRMRYLEAKQSNRYNNNKG